MNLPPTGPLTLAGIDVGRGRLIAPDPKLVSADSTGPVLWLGSEPQSDGGKRWSALSKAFPNTGLWPLLLQSMSGEPRRPWEDGELDPTSSESSDAEQALSLLARSWSDNMPVEEENDSARDAIRPFGANFPGLASIRGTSVKHDAPDRVAKEIASKDRRLGLVAVERSADAVAVIGWMGAINHADAGSLSSVLRSWEDRFGTVVVGVEFDVLTLAVRRPPITEDEALATAAEHFAFCPDNIYQGVGSIKKYASGLVNSHRWDFWWD